MIPLRCVKTYPKDFQDHHLKPFTHCLSIAMLNKKIIMLEIRDYLMVALATLMYAFAVTAFMLPYGLTTGGVAGISAIIFYATGLKIQISYAFINAAFLVMAARIVGLRFCLKTIWGFGMITFWLWVCQTLMEDPVTHELPKLIGDEIFMACVLAAIFEGIGLSISFYFNGSTGGTDIIAACINKYKDISLGQILMVCDILIVSSCYLVFHDIQRVIFGYVLLILAAITLDYCTRRFHQAVEFKIFSRNHSAIADAINKKGFGVTMLDGFGWYTKTTRKVLICICNKRYSETIMREIKRVDPTCFVSITNAQNVYGEGFGMIKTKVKGQKPIIVFATNNANKLREVREILSDRFEVRSLKDVGCMEDLPETFETLEENAMQKARHITKYYGFDCFSDDTGLEVEALDGAPGVYSARYANISDPDYFDPLVDSTKDHDTKANIRKLLAKMKGKENRKAQFRTSIALIYKGKEYYFEGIVKGTISEEEKGTNGFGYDPVFVPEGYNESFAEISSDIKNKISHRALAIEKLATFLKDGSKR